MGILLGGKRRGGVEQLRRVLGAAQQHGFALQRKAAAKGRVGAARRGNALPEGEGRRVRGNLLPGRGAAGRQRHVLQSAAGILCAKNATIIVNITTNTILRLRRYLQRSAPVYAHALAALEPEYAHALFRREKGGEAQRHALHGLFPNGFAEAESHLFVGVAGGEEAHGLAVDLGPEQLRPLDGERVALPGEKGTLPGICVP